MSDLTHFTAEGDAHMVDVGGKPVTDREATAKGDVFLAADTLSLIEKGDAKKGDVLGVARLAGIMAAKRTSDLIPLCHPLPLSRIAITFAPQPAEGRIEITADVSVSGRTGVEMEALTAVSVAALTIYDMVKAVDRTMRIGNIRLTHKEGGQSGSFDRA